MAKVSAVRQANNKAYHAANRDAILARKRERYAANREQAKARKRELYAADPERHRSYGRKYRKAHPEVMRASEATWRRANLENGRLRCALRRARMAGCGTGLTVADIRAQYERQDGKCFYCSLDLAPDYQVDHVIPLSKGGRHGRDNVVIACRSCNARKGATDPQVFAGILL